MSAVKGAHLLEHPWTWKWKGLKVDSKENDGARPTQSGIFFLFGFNYSA